MYSYEYFWVSFLDWYMTILLCFTSYGRCVINYVSNVILKFYGANDLFIRKFKVESTFPTEIQILGQWLTTHAKRWLLNSITIIVFLRLRSTRNVSNYFSNKSWSLIHVNNWILVWSSSSLILLTFIQWGYIMRTFW